MDRMKNLIRVSASMFLGSVFVTDFHKFFKRMVKDDAMSMK